MTTLTRERLEQLANFRGAPVTRMEEQELARIALAAMQQEPVGYFGRFDPDDEDLIDQCSANIKGAFPLYAAPPAPVVPDDDIDERMKEAGMLSAAEIIAGQPIDAFMKHAGVVDFDSLLKWAEMRRSEFLRMQAKYELGESEKDDMYEWVISHVAAFSEIHVNIRAAILQAGNSPVIQDGWISCSERMPSPDSKIIAYTDMDGVIYDMRYKWSRYQDCEWMTQSTRWSGSKVTHWMPLPAAPQQEVK